MVTDLMERSVYTGHVEFADWGIPLRKGYHEPIISLETYQKVQVRRNGSAKLSKRADINEDFILRGAVCCADCDAPYRSAWSQGKRKKYAYYVCQTKVCDSYGKSIARDKLEGAFEAFLRRLSPAEGLFAVVRACSKTHGISAPHSAHRRSMN